MDDPFQKLQKLLQEGGLTVVKTTRPLQKEQLPELSKESDFVFITRPSAQSSNQNPDDKIMFLRGDVSKPEEAVKRILT